MVKTRSRFEKTAIGPDVKLVSKLTPHIRHILRVWGGREAVVIDPEHVTNQTTRARGSFILMPRRGEDVIRHILIPKGRGSGNLLYAVPLNQTYGNSSGVLKVEKWRRLPRRKRKGGYVQTRIPTIERQSMLFQSSNLLSSLLEDVKSGLVGGMKRNVVDQIKSHVDKAESFKRSFKRPEQMS